MAVPFFSKYGVVTMSSLPFVACDAAATGCYDWAVTTGSGPTTRPCNTQLVSSKIDSIIDS